VGAATRILLVDDESFMRTVARRILEADGYEIVEAADGVEALALAETEPFDVVVTDVMMPRMNGLELISGLADRRGAVRAVVTSAYVERLPSDAPENVSWCVVPKPYTAQTLLSAVSEALAD
jgi:CheY-like chemotaxis protein